MSKALNMAMRIARTEGHRVNQQGFLDAGTEAKKKGTDIIKQWDATLDSVTRPGIRKQMVKSGNGMTSLMLVVKR